MDRRLKRRVARAAGALLVAGLGVGLWLASDVVAVGVAYKAKMVCSGIFVAEREASAVVADLHIDDLTVLESVGLSVDLHTRSVTASAFGLITRRAVYRDGLGCALALDGLTPPARVANDTNAPRSDDLRRPVVEPESPKREGTNRRELDLVVGGAFSESDPQRPKRTLAVVVLHQGAIVAERYATGMRPETPIIGWSMTKSVMNALVGTLVKEGRVTLDAPVPIDEWQRPDDPRRSITLDNLLRMTSGLRFDEDMSNPRADVMRTLLGVGDAAKYAAGKDLIAAPGTRWRYSSGSTNIISRAIRDLIQDDEAYWNFPRRALFDRVGMTSAVMETDAAGTFVASSYMYATARDWARFGLLYAQDGIWDGERILAEGWVKYTTSPAPADPERRYGAHFWLEIADEYGGPGGRLPADAFHAAGHEGQFVTIVPSREIVIVRLGRTRRPHAWNQSAFVFDVIAALDRIGR
jgi:CubicO group peptidase (beta-lactamase class C family)